MSSFFLPGIPMYKPWFTTKT